MKTSFKMHDLPHYNTRLCRHCTLKCISILSKVSSTEVEQESDKLADEFLEGDSSESNVDAFLEKFLVRTLSFFNQAHCELIDVILFIVNERKLSCLIFSTGKKTTLSYATC